MSCNTYLVPAGKLYYDPCPGTGEIYLGQTPGSEISVDIKTVEVMSSDDPVSELIAEIPHSVVREQSFKCINPSDEVLALFFAADPAAQTQASGTVTNEAISGVQQGRYYQIGQSTSNPTGVRGVSAVAVDDADGAGASAWTATTAAALGSFGKPTVSNSYYYEATVAGTTAGSEPTWPTTVGATVTDGTVTWTCKGKITLTVATDYTLDAELARLYIVPGGGIADGTNLLVDYTKAANSRMRHAASPDLAARLAGSLRFIANNTSGPNRDVYAPRVVLRADGNATIKRSQGDGKVTEFGFKAKFQRIIDDHGNETLAALYIDGRAVAA